MLEILKGFSIADWVLIIGVLLNSAYNFIANRVLTKNHIQHLIDGQRDIKKTLVDHGERIAKIEGRLNGFSKKE